MEQPRDWAGRRGAQRACGAVLAVVEGTNERRELPTVWRCGRVPGHAGYHQVSGGPGMRWADSDERLSAALGARRRRK